MPPIPSISAQRKGKLTKKKMDSPDLHSGLDDQHLILPPSPARAHKTSRIRVVGNRIYDSVNGKSCHQCRQKTRDFVASCKNLRNNKPCTINYCYKCLSNRYGEKAEDMAVLEDWKCPKCRSICNCSFCRKKIGCSPTGILVHTAKASGFSSVSEMLQSAGSGNICKSVKDKVCSPKTASQNKESLAVSPKKGGKENSFDGMEGLNMLPQNLISSPDETKPKKLKRAQLKVHDDNKNCGASLKKSNSKRPRITQELSKNEKRTDGKDDAVQQEKDPKASVPQKASPDSNVIDKTGEQEAKPNKVGVEENAGPKANKLAKSLKVKKHTMKIERKEFDIDFNVPVSNDPLVAGQKGEEVDGTTSQNMGGLHNAIINNAGAKLNKINKYPKVSKHELEFQTKESDVDVSMFCNAHVIGGKGEDRDCNTFQNVGDLDNATIDNAGAKPNKVAKSQEVKKQGMTWQLKEFHADVPLPQGVRLTTVAGIELSPEDVGHALQLLEFCAVFGKVFGIRKGQAESVLQELVHGYKGPERRLSLTAQLHIKLLSLILKYSGENTKPLTWAKGKNSWLQALGNCISTSPYALKDLPANCFGRGDDGYNALGFSKKLRVLNFLCDESLCTERLRRYIDNQHSKLVEKEKAAKENVLAAKDKAKRMKQKLHGEKVKVIIAQNDASISKHEAVLSQIKTECEQAHAEMMEAVNTLSQMKQRSDAVRTEPIFSDVSGHSFWRLKPCNGDSDILLQDMGTWIADVPDEKWFSYGLELKDSIEEYISLREKKIRFHKISKRHPMESNQAQSLPDIGNDMECPTKIEAADARN